MKYQQLSAILSITVISSIVIANCFEIMHIRSVPSQISYTTTVADLTPDIAAALATTLPAAWQAKPNTTGLVLFNPAQGLITRIYADGTTISHEGMNVSLRLVDYQIDNATVRFDLPAFFGPIIIGEQPRWW